MERWVAACLGAALLTWSTAPVAAKQTKPDLRALAGELHLDLRGAQEWLRALGVSGGGETSERLVAVTRDGRVVERREGSADKVPFDRELYAYLVTEGAQLTLIHNHPKSTGLSIDDLSHLRKQGVIAVVAIGNDGSLYMAAAGPRFDRAHFEEAQYVIAHDEVERKLKSACAARQMSTVVSSTHQAHIVSVVLAKAGIIEYRAELSADRLLSYYAARVSFGEVSEAAAWHVRRHAMPLPSGRR